MVCCTLLVAYVCGKLGIERGVPVPKALQLRFHLPPGTDI